MSRSTIFGTIGILALVVAARWFALDTEMEHWSGSSSSSATRSGAPEAAVMRLDWSADGRSLLCHFRGLVEGQSSVTVLPLAPAGRRMPAYVAEQPIVTAALAPDGLHILLATARGELSWMDTESFEVVTLIRFPPMTDLAELAIFDNELVAAGTGDGRIYLSDPGRQVFSELTTVSAASISSLEFSRDGKRLVSGSGDGSIAVWDLASRTQVQNFCGHARSSTLASFLSDGQCCLSGGMDDTIRIWEIVSGREIWQRECGLTGLRALDVSPDGTTTAWGGHDRKVVVWDLERRRKKFEFVTNAPFLSTVRFSPDGTMLAVAGAEPTIYMCNVRTGDKHTFALPEAIEHSTR